VAGRAKADMNARDAPSADTPTRLRLWPLAIIVLLALGGVAAALFLGAGSERDTQSGIPWTIVFVTAGVTLLALAAWLLLLSRMAARPKWIIFVVATLTVAAPVATLKIDYTGNLTPSAVRWRDWVVRLFGPRRLVIEEQGRVDLMTAGPHDVPEFLGPGRRPVFSDVLLETDWNAHPPRELWRQPIGLGFGSFAVVGDFAVTQQQEGALELVVCYQWRTGKPKWKHADQASFTSSLGGDGPRATPTIDGGRVYTMGATGILNCLDGNNGSLVWQRDTLKENHARNLDWGISCSPLVVDNLVVVSAGLNDSGVKTREYPHYALIAYDKLTGKPVWRAGTDEGSYCSPTLITLDGMRQIAIANGHSVTGHDPADGRILWEFPWPGGMPTVSQVVALDEEHVWMSKGYGIGSGVRKITRDEAGQWTVAEVWSKPTVMRTKFTNVVIVGEQAYGLDDGFLQCIDLDKPRVRWTTRRHREVNYQHGQVILVGDVLLVQSEQGDVSLVAASADRFEELCTFSPLSGRTWNYPVLVGNYLLTRNDREAVCYELPKRKSLKIK